MSNAELPPPSVAIRNYFAALDRYSQIGGAAGPGEGHPMHYRGGYQLGGSNIFYYRGGPQIGGGFGDIMRGFFKWLLPVAVQSAAQFTGTFAQQQREGKSLKESAKEALKPAAEVLLDETTKAAKRKLRGGGKRKRKKKKKSKVYKEEFPQPTSTKKSRYKKIKLVDPPEKFNF